MTKLPAPNKHKKHNKLTEKSGASPAPPKQMRLDLGIKVERNVAGIEMGVLENGIPYLTQRGLAAISGAARSTIFEITQEWKRGFEDPIIVPGTRIGFLKDYLLRNRYDEPKLYIEILKNNSPHYAYPDVVCMAIIEFFAFESQKTNETALRNYRNFARYGLQMFIYEALNYVPENNWRYFNDRVSILKNSAPDGYFIVFNEVTGLAVDLINSGLSVNDKTIPDTSVGIHWGKYWSENSVNRQFDERISWDHYYPDYYPQAASNPQTPWAYPDEALPLFRRWFRTVYLTSKFPEYILRKANILKGGRQEAIEIAGLYDQKAIAAPKTVDKRKKEPIPETRTIVLPQSDYQPPKSELEAEHDMPGSSVETVRRAFFRSIHVKKLSKR